MVSLVIHIYCQLWLPEMIRAVHQFIPCLVNGDAVGSHTLEVRKLLIELGFESETYIGAVGSDIAIETHFYEKYGSRKQNRKSSVSEVLLYHSSTGCPMARFLYERPEPLLINYHNITPADDFEAWNQMAANTMIEARDELRLLARRTHHAIADSSYNEQELEVLGYKSTSIAPILFDPRSFERETDERTLEWLMRLKNEGGSNILFVGRVAPNKAQHNIIAAFALYKQLFDPNARLFIVGGSPIPEYLPVLRRYAARLKVKDSIDFAGFVTDKELSAYYKGCDLFLCLSDHEGFCVPLLEAMYNKLPIIAYNAAAIPETLGGAGILLNDKRPSIVASAIDRVVNDVPLRNKMIELGTIRLTDFDYELSKKSFQSSIELALADL